MFGYLGVFFGKLIKSAISRQREFLADASSVQFTRNPGGIAGALKKIGGLSRGLADSRRPRRGNQPHVLRRRLCRHVFQSFRHAPAAGRSASGRSSRSLTAVFPRSNR